ncbi:hypothetical protein [Aureimonas sp. AU40]|uniref:hypothetical protein n=1 Tax=Aureimonas sp. AU40 TaxID=1637747 RepID=UPI000A4B179A|nr:hypothetical protein [Aureimonas sp. AU40]
MNGTFVVLAALTMVTASTFISMDEGAYRAKHGGFPAGILYSMFASWAAIGMLAYWGAA